MINFKDRFIITTIILSFIFGIMLGEDSLGGGKHDYLYHVKYFYNFYSNFYETFTEYGVKQNTENVRNSPFYYMIFSQLLHFKINLIGIKIVNLFVLFPLFYFLNKCLELKFVNISIVVKLYFFSILLLSPTIRTLLSWPYPLIWAITFFVISIYFYMRFNYSSHKIKNIKFAYLNVSTLALAAYITPNFCVFSIFFFYKFYNYFKNSLETLKIVFLNILLAAPAVIFIITKDFYLFNSNVGEVSNATKYNISNKIIIINSILFLFLLPIISSYSKFKFNMDKFKLNFSKIFCLIIFFITNIFFFNYFGKNIGGGIFFHLSNYILGNSFLVIFIFALSLIMFDYLKLYNLDNLILYLVLILYNLQYEIYYKYFDPLILLIIFFLMKLDFNNIPKLEILVKRYIILYFVFLVINLSKGFLRYY